MALYIASLNSGSNGNCYYVGNDTDAILVDVGLSCRETEKRMKKLNLNLNNVKAIFVSHEHGDHIKGVSTLANKYSLPVYITPKTANNGPILIKHLSKFFMANEPLQIGSLIVTAFTKKHDAADPHSFIISFSGVTVGVFTDIGIVCDEVVRYFKQCQAVFLESNFDEELLENGKYPIYLKNRIRGGHGHLSNKQALELFIENRATNLSYLLLSHLSKENNSPELALDLYKPFEKNTKVIIASRYESSEVYKVVGDTNNEKQLCNYSKTIQLGLFS